jgi:hypothetical protein
MRQHSLWGVPEHLPGISPQPPDAALGCNRLARTAGRSH